MSRTPRSERIDYPTPVELTLLDIPTSKGRGFYVVARNLDPNRTWRGATLWQSPKEKSGYREYSEVDQEAVVGYVRWGPENKRYRQGELDLESRIIVMVPEVYQPLESVDDMAFAAGRNTFLIGSEIDQVQRWEFIGRTQTLERIYAGTKIRRGLWKTGISNRRHNPGEVFIWLDSGGIEFKDTASPLLETHRYWKAVPPGFSLHEAEVVEVTHVPQFNRASLAWNWAACIAQSFRS